MVRAGLILAAILPFSGAYVMPSTFMGSRLQAMPTTSPSGNTLSMKIFDWKRRDPAVDAWLDDVEWKLHNLKPAPGSNKRKKRKGRGIAAGQGASCGFGMRGQRSRSGRGVKIGFEGGQTPLYRRIPKYRGRPMGPGFERKIHAVISLNALSKCEPGETVRYSTLVEKGIVSKSKHIRSKVLGNGELTVDNLTVEAHGFSATAQRAIEARGGKCILLTKHGKIDMELPVRAEIELAIAQNEESERAAIEEQEQAAIAAALQADLDACETDEDKEALEGRKHSETVRAEMRAEDDAEALAAMWEMYNSGISLNTIYRKAVSWGKQNAVYKGFRREVHEKEVAEGRLPESLAGYDPETGRRRKGYWHPKAKPTVADLEVAVAQVQSMREKYGVVSNAPEETMVISGEE